MYTRLKPQRVKTSNTPTPGQGLGYIDEENFEWEDITGDMKYSDFEWETLTGSTITIEDINNNITPTEDFSISVSSGTLKAGIEYHLRVNSGSTQYAMSLGTGVTNPNGYSTELKPNAVTQFTFIATSDSQLELEGVDTSDFVTLSTQQSITAKKTFNVEPELSTAKTSDATNNGVKFATEAQVYKKADDNKVVHIAGAETITGSKTFSAEPVLPSKSTAAGNNPTKPATEAQVYLKSDDDKVVHLAGTETITGNKTFQISPTVPSKSTDAGNNPTTIATEAQVEKKIDKVASPTADNLASLTSGGEVADSGIAKSTVELNTNRETGDAPTDTTTKYPSSHTVKKYVDDQVSAATAGAVSDAAYDATTWDSVTGIAPSKNAVRDKIVSMDSNISTNASDISTINGKIPSAASTSNQLADKAFVNSSINSVTAYYITKNAAGDQFATYAELSAATTFYSGGEVRTPTRNDYCIVQADENHDNATTRYIYNNGWEYQYTINETPLTQAQLDALNSGITSGKVSTYDGYATGKQDKLTAGDNITINGATISADVNVKIFEVSGTSDTTNALRAVNWYKSGNLPIIKYRAAGMDPEIYYLKDVSVISEITGERYGLDFYTPTIAGDKVKKLNFYTNAGGSSVTITQTTSSLYSAGPGIGISGTSISNSGVTSLDSQTGAVTLKTINNNALVGTGNITIDAVIKSATAPASATEGDLWYDTTNDKLKAYNGTSWEVVGDGDMKYSDYNWVAKTGSTITMDLACTMHPSSNFTVNAPSSIKDGQTYILRVDNGSIAYTMTLGTNMTNPFGTNIELTAGGIDQFVFLAIGGNLELQPEGGQVPEGIMILSPDSPIKPKYKWYGTQADYDALTQYYTDEPNDTVYFTI